MLELKFPAYLLSTEVKKIETSFLEKKTIELIRQKGNINVRTLGELTTTETKYPEIVIPIIEECITNPEFDYEIPTIISFLYNYKPTKKYINI